MTDTRLAAMQAVVEAARADMGEWSVSTRQALQAALAALDALSAQPAGETVEVRAHVYLDLADGGFVIHEAGYEVSPRYRRHVATLTARVLLPTVPTITADVEVTP
jgi:hypothetical protein